MKPLKPMPAHWYLVSLNILSIGTVIVTSQVTKTEKLSKYLRLETFMYNQAKWLPRVSCTGSKRQNCTYKVEPICHF